MANNTGTSGDEQRQNDLMAALASARELGPDMDKAVAASYLEKQKQQTTAQAQVQAQQTTVAAQRQRRPMFLMGLPIGVIIFIAILVASGGHAWFMFWLIFCFGGLGWWGWGERHDEHVQRRMDRWERRRARFDARYGSRYGGRYGPYDPYDRGNEPPRVQEPQSQPQSPTEYD